MVEVVLRLNSISHILPTNAPCQRITAPSLVEGGIVSIVVEPFSCEYRFLNNLKLPGRASDVLTGLRVETGDIDVYVLAIWHNC